MRIRPRNTQTTSGSKCFVPCGSASLPLESMTGFEHRIGMLRSRYLFLPVLALTIAMLLNMAKAVDQPGTQPKQFIYILRLVPRLYSDANWTKDDKMALDRHFARFQHSIQTGELILAGAPVNQAIKLSALPSSKQKMRWLLEPSWKAIRRLSPV